MQLLRQLFLKLFRCTTQLISRQSQNHIEIAISLLLQLLLRLQGKIANIFNQKQRDLINLSKNLHFLFVWAFKIHCAFLQGQLVKTHFQRICGDLLIQINSRECLSKPPLKLLQFLRRIRHRILEFLLSWKHVVLLDDSVIEIPQVLCLLVHFLLNFFYFSEHFDSQLLEEAVYLQLKWLISLRTQRKSSYSLNEIEVVWERPLPEDSLEVAVSNLRKRNEIFRLNDLFDDTIIAFEDCVGAFRISAQKRAFFILMSKTQPLNGLLQLLRWGDLVKYLWCHFKEWLLIWFELLFQAVIFNIFE